MQTRTLVGIAVLFALSLMIAAQPKGDRVTITGEVVDMWCYLEGGDRKGDDLRRHGEVSGQPTGRRALTHRVRRSHLQRSRRSNSGAPA
jgi:type 1 fimbria pilin